MNALERDRCSIVTKITKPSAGPVCFFLLLSQLPKKPLLHPKASPFRKATNLGRSPMCFYFGGKLPGRRELQTQIWASAVEVRSLEPFFLQMPMSGDGSMGLVWYIYLMWIADFIWLSVYRYTIHVSYGVWFLWLSVYRYTIHVSCGVYMQWYDMLNSKYCCRSDMMDPGSKLAIVMGVSFSQAENLGCLWPGYTAGIWRMMQVWKGSLFQTWLFSGWYLGSISRE